VLVHIRNGPLAEHQAGHRRVASAAGADASAAIFLQLWMSKQTFDDFEPEQKAKFQELVRRWMQVDRELAEHQLVFPQLQ
jgi:hypothetical protein